MRESTFGNDREPTAAMLKKYSLPTLLLLALSLQGCGGSSPVVRTPYVNQKYPATVTDIRMWHAPKRSRIVFDMNRRVALPTVFTLKNPHRVVVDLKHVRITSALPAPNTTGQFIRRIRHGSPKQNIVRLVFDLDKPVRYFIRMLPPSDLYQYRLVVDFYHQNAVLATDKTARPVTPRKQDAKPATAKTVRPVTPRKPKSELVVLIDPGHGGEDPGAVGTRTQEKKVVLQIAKKLKAQIDKKPGLRALLTRTKDYYISLRKRTHIARRSEADLFISIHADSFQDKRARGASVYALSQHGASSEAAKWLADKENAADLVGGVSLADEDELLAEVLLDLSMSKTISESISFGKDMLTELKKSVRVRSDRVERAGFAVLKSPDIPSILVETAYITNPQEEKQLMSNAHQNRLALAMANAIENYRSKNRSRYVTR